MHMFSVMDLLITHAASPHFHVTSFLLFSASLIVAPASSMPNTLDSSISRTLTSPSSLYSQYAPSPAHPSSKNSIRLSMLRCREHTLKLLFSSVPAGCVRNGMSSVFTTEMLNMSWDRKTHYFGLLSAMLKMATWSAEEIRLFKYMRRASSSVMGVLSS